MYGGRDRTTCRRSPRSRFAKAGHLAAVGDSFDNAMAESWFGTINLSCCTDTSGAPGERMRWRSFRWIEGLYNPRRVEASFGWAAPGLRGRTRPLKTCRSPPLPSLHRSSARSSTIEMAEPTRRMDHEERVDEPGCVIRGPRINQNWRLDTHRDLPAAGLRSRCLTSRFGSIRVRASFRPRITVLC